MGSTSSKQDSSIISSTSFVYKDLVVHIRNTQNQMVKRIKHLDERVNKEKKIKDQLKFHSLTIIDPYGNSITEPCMDHELISTVLRKFKKNYIPKCLHQWIQFGYLIKNEIVPMDESQLTSTVAQYENEHPIITYGQVTLWIGLWESRPGCELVLTTRLTDNIEAIQMQLKFRTKAIFVEVKTSIIGEKTEPSLKDWKEGTTLNPEDTIMSKSLYQDHSIIMIRITTENVNTRFILFPFQRIFFRNRLMRIFILVVFRCL